MIWPNQSTGANASELRLLAMRKRWAASVTQSDVGRQRMRHFNIIFFLSALLVAGCAANKPVYPLPCTAFPEPGVYLVQPGDSATLIANNLCLSVERLSTLNPGMDWSHLKIGQRLYYASPPTK